MNLQQVFRLLVVTLISGLSILTLSGFFFFIFPLGLFLPDDKKAVTELEQKQDWQGLLALADKRLQDQATASSGGGNHQMYATENMKTKDGVSPAEAPWLYIKGIALQKLKRCPEAIDAYQRAILAKSGVFLDAKNNIGNCQLELAQNDAALLTYKSIIASNPEYWQAYYNASLASVNKKDLAEANVYEQQLRPRNIAMADNLKNLYIKPLEMKLELEKISATAKQAQEKPVQTVASSDSDSTSKSKVVAEVVQGRGVPPRDAAPVPSNSVEAQLTELKQLYDKGLISKEVYESKQLDILKLK